MEDVLNLLLLLKLKRLRLAKKQPNKIHTAAILIISTRNATYSLLVGAAFT